MYQRCSISRGVAEKVFIVDEQKWVPRLTGA
jgi:hypothetical protein